MVKTTRFCGCKVMEPCTCTEFTCSGCEEATLSRDECRWREGKYGPTLVDRRCKACRAADDAAYYARNAERVRERQREYRSDPEVRQRLRAYNRERMSTEEAKARDRERSQLPHRKRKTRDGNLRRAYGIGVDDYEAMFAAQEGRCAICGASESNTKMSEHLHVDHDHETGQVRALLCNPCNIGLGCFADSPERLRQALAYIEHWQSIARGIRGQT